MDVLKFILNRVRIKGNPERGVIHDIVCRNLRGPCHAAIAKRLWGSGRNAHDIALRRLTGAQQQHRCHQAQEEMEAFHENTLAVSYP